MMSRSIEVFDKRRSQQVARLLAQAHARLGQHDRHPADRTTSARNYDSSIRQLLLYMEAHDAVLPTRALLEQWRDAMRDGVGAERKAPRTINARLSAVRKLLNMVADESTDIEVKLILRDWAKVANTKLLTVSDADRDEQDYGKRLTLEATQELLRQPDTSTLPGLRDRAMIALMVGAGLRLSEVVAVTIADVFHTRNERGSVAINIRRGKHNKKRKVVLDGSSSWVLEACRQWADAAGININPTVRRDTEAALFRAFEQTTNRRLLVLHGSISERRVEYLLSRYRAWYMGEWVQVSPHDLRRTYAKLSKSAGMSWEALRDNMGHASVEVTERYVGRDIDWEDRVPAWRVEL